MKKYYLVALSIVVCMFLIAGVPINKEQTFDQTQTFTKPIEEGSNKAGVWADAYNSGMVDPGDYFTYEEDFYAIVHATTTNACMQTDYFGVLNAGTIAAQNDAPGGEIWLTTAAVTDAVVNLQLNGESFQCTGEKKIWFETRLNFEDVSHTEWFIGLALEDTTIMAGTTDRIGFQVAASDTSVATEDIAYVVEYNSQETTADTGFNLTDATAVRLGFMADCPGTTTGTVTFYVNDNPIVVSTTEIPYDEALTPTMEVKAFGTSGLVADVPQKMEVDYIKIMQER